MIKRFKNGNMNVRVNKKDYCDKESDLVNLLWELEGECDLLGEEQCINNWEMGVFVYSFYTDKKYLINYSKLDDWRKGKVLKLIAEPMTDLDREILAEEYS